MQLPVRFLHRSVNRENKVDALSEFPCWRARLFGHHLFTPSSAVVVPLSSSYLYRESGNLNVLSSEAESMRCRFETVLRLGLVKTD